jgi:Flp pilus assembly protein TadB
MEEALGIFFLMIVVGLVVGTAMLLFLGLVATAALVGVLGVLLLPWLIRGFKQGWRGQAGP